MNIDIEQALQTFLDDREGQFKRIKKSDKQEWIEAIEEEITLMLNGSDLFYDTMPSQIEEKESD